MSNTYQDENGETHFRERQINKQRALHDIIMIMTNNEISFQDFLDFIDEGSKKYNAMKADCKKDFDEQSALIEITEMEVKNLGIEETKTE